MSIPRLPSDAPLLYWKPVAAAGLLTLALVISAVAMVSRSSTSEQAIAIIPIKAECKGGPGSQVVLAFAKPDPLFGAQEAPPEVLSVAGLADPQPEEAAPTPPDASPPPSPPGPVKDTFGTAIEFERNMTEAVQLAKQERKLLFLLHVSGNFDDTAFT